MCSVFFICVAFLRPVFPLCDSSTCSTCLKYTHICLCTNIYMFIFSLYMWIVWCVCVCVCILCERFVIVLFWFSRTYIPNVYSGMRFCVDDCWLGVLLWSFLARWLLFSSHLVTLPIEINEKCSTRHDSTFYCLFYEMKIHLTFFVAHSIWHYIDSWLEIHRELNQNERIPNFYVQDRNEKKIVVVKVMVASNQRKIISHIYQLNTIEKNQRPKSKCVALSKWPTQPFHILLYQSTWPTCFQHLIIAVLHKK